MEQAHIKDRQPLEEIAGTNLVQGISPQRPLLLPEPNPETLKERSRFAQKIAKLKND